MEGAPSPTFLTANMLHGFVLAFRFLSRDHIIPISPLPGRLGRVWHAKLRYVARSTLPFSVVGRLPKEPEILGWPHLSLTDTWDGTTPPEGVAILLTVHSVGSKAITSLRLPKHDFYCHARPFPEGKAVLKARLTVRTPSRRTGKGEFISPAYARLPLHCRNRLSPIKVTYNSMAIEN